MKHLRLSITAGIAAITILAGTLGSSFAMSSNALSSSTENFTTPVPTEIFCNETTIYVGDSTNCAFPPGATSYSTSNPAISISDVDSVNGKLTITGESGGGVTLYVDNLSQQIEVVTGWWQW